MDSVRCHSMQREVADAKALNQVNNLPLRGFFST